MAVQEHGGAGCERAQTLGTWMRWSGEAGATKAPAARVSAGVGRTFWMYHDDARHTHLYLIYDLRAKRYPRFLFFFHPEEACPSLPCFRLRNRLLGLPSRHHISCTTWYFRLLLLLLLVFLPCRAVWPTRPDHAVRVVVVVRIGACCTMYLL